MMQKYVIEADHTLLVLLDIQERLAAAMEERESVVSNALHLLELARLFQMPVLVTEQYPQGIGPTVPELRQALEDYRPIVKTSFSCCNEESFIEALVKTGRKTVLICGMETHICVLQTAVDLLRKGYYVHIVSDGATSRKELDKERGLRYMEGAGAVITTTETALFQVLKKSGTEDFRIISKRIK